MAEHSVLYRTIPNDFAENWRSRLAYFNDVARRMKIAGSSFEPEFLEAISSMASKYVLFGELALGVWNSDFSARTELPIICSIRSDRPPLETIPIRPANGAVLVMAHNLVECPTHGLDPSRQEGVNALLDAAHLQDRTVQFTIRDGHGENVFQLQVASPLSAMCGALALAFHHLPNLPSELFDVRWAGAVDHVLEIAERNLISEQNGPPIATMEGIGSLMDEMAARIQLDVSAIAGLDWHARLRNKEPRSKAQILDTLESVRSFVLCGRFGSRGASPDFGPSQ